MKIEKSFIYNSQNKIPCPELRGSIESIKYPAFAEAKLDGEFSYIHIGKENFVINKYGKIRRDFPILHEFSKQIKSNAKSATLLGELIAGQGINGDLYKLLALKDSDTLNLWSFDILELDGNDIRSQLLIDRKEILLELLTPKWTLWSKLINNKEEAINFFNEATSQGYEGIVLKPINSKLILDACDWVKVKYKDQTDYKVTHVDPTQERIEVEVHNPKTFVIVGVKAPHRYKKFIKPGDLVTIEHQGMLASGSLRHPVLIPKKEWK